MAKIRFTGLYPEHEVRTALEDFWDRTVDEDGAADLGLSPGIALDSLSATDVLLEIETVLGLKDQQLPEALVQSGGYDSKEEFVEHLASRIKACVS